MSMTKKKLTAVLAAVSMYIQAEEEALAMPPSEKSVPRKFYQGNLWGISGRQDLMQGRNMMNMRVFNR